MKMEKFHILNKEKFKHLKEGMHSIQICLDIYDVLNYDDLSGRTEKLKKNSQDIKWRGKTEYYAKNHILSNKDGNWSISEINEQNKFSEKYLNCTGVVLVGTDKETGENISILTHQETDAIKNDKIFLETLSRQVKEFVSMCEEGTIDSLVFGGNNDNDDLKEYESSILNLRETLTPVLGFYPDVATGPKLAGHDTKVFFDTQKRQFHFFIPKQKDIEIYKDYNSSQAESRIFDFRKKLKEK